MPRRFAIQFYFYSALTAIGHAASADADNDGLRDVVETNTGVYVSASNTGTNPNMADSDGDSLPDGLELNLGTNPTSAASKVKRPNIIYILADDLGYGDVGCFWQNQRTGIWKFATPGLDAMAAEGAMMTHHYVGAPICASSRASFLQGQHQGHAGIRDAQFDKALPNDHNVASVLKEVGYRTIHVGKSGLAGTLSNPLLSSAGLEGHPLKRGFDRYFGYLRHLDGHEHYPRNGNAPRLAAIHDDYTPITDAHVDVYTSDVFTGFAKKTIIEETTEHPERPFFLYLSYDTPHFFGQYAPTANYPTGKGLSGGIQWTGAPSYVNTATNDPTKVDNQLNYHPSVNLSWYPAARKHVSMIRRMDDSVADILQTLRDLRIDDNTLVVFTSDNGPAPQEVYPGSFESSGPFRGIKTDLLEGGIRVPTIVWWPGKITATNQLSNIRQIPHPSGQWDWMASFAEMAKVTAPAVLDGVSLIPTLTGQGVQRDKGHLYFEFLYGGATRGQMQAVRVGDYMGLRTEVQWTTNASEPFKIYNVVTDPKQATDVAATRPDLVSKMNGLAVSARRKGGGVIRPWDEVRIPAISSIPVRQGLNWKSYEGYWPWLPEFRDLAPTSTGQAADISPSVRSRDTDVGISFEGYLSVPAGGAYTFQTVSDAATSLWIHDSHVIDNDFNHTATKTSDPVYLSAGLHPLRLYYRHQQGFATLELKYSGPGIPLQKIPASSFFVEGKPTVLLADTASTAKASPVTVDVLANDTAQNPLQLANVGPPRNGSAVILDQKVVYTPSANFLGKDEFSYSVNDGVQTASSTVQARVLFGNEVWIPLDDGAGTSVNAYAAEISTSGVLSGSINPSGAWASGRHGSALVFDGVDMQVQFPGLAIPAGNAARSFSCWIKTDHPSLTESQTLLTYGQGTSEQRFTIRLDRGPSSPESLVASVEALPGKLMGTKALNDGAWHHLMVVLADEDQNGSANLSEVKLYVDGQPDLPSSVNPGIPLTANGSNLLLGGRDDVGNGNFKGLLDDVRIFPRALTSTEAGALHQLTLANVIFDTDGDGFKDLEEEVAGTNPSDPSSFFKLDTAVLPNGSINLTWAGVAGRTYVLEESTELGAWHVVEELAPLVLRGATPNATVTLPTNGDSQRFFRMKVSLTNPPGPDHDRDGFPDTAETMAGTNPSDPNSFFRIDLMTTTQSGISVQWKAVAGRRYRVEESNNLFQWTRVRNLPPVEATTATPNASIVVPANGEPKRFLRMQVEMAQ